jgi:hypothetical protein
MLHFSLLNALSFTDVTFVLEYIWSSNLVCTSKLIRFFESSGEVNSIYSESFIFCFLYKSINIKVQNRNFIFFFNMGVKLGFSPKALSRMFGPKREKVTEGWRKLHNEELHNLYSLLSIWLIKSKKTEWVEHATDVKKMRPTYKILVWEPEERRSLGTPGH